MNNVSVKVKHRKSKVAGRQSALCIQLIFRRRMKRIPLDRKVYDNEWDPMAETVRIPPETDRQRSEYLWQLSETIDSQCRLIRQIIAEQGTENSFSVDDIAALYKERTAGIYLSGYIRRQADIFAGRRQGATARHYLSLEKSFRSFLGKEIRIDTIDETLIRKYEHYLESKGLMSNTISFYLRNFRSILNKACADGLIKECAHFFRYVNTRIEKTQKRAIKEEEMKKVEQLTDTELKQQGTILARDLFLFAYYTRGMAFVDIAHLTRDNIKGNMLVYTRRKTGQELRIKILPEIQELIDRYRSDSPYLFPILQTSEAEYKEYESALRLQNQRLEIIGLLVDAKLSTYVPRHTWASVAKRKGVSDELIAEGMGHTSIKTTKIYIALPDNTNIDRINEFVISGKMSYKMAF